MVKSPAENVVIPAISVPQFLLSMAAAHGDKVGLINGVTGEIYTYNQYADASRKVASALFRRGVGRGSMVAIHCRNSPEFPIIATAVLCTGATLTPASTSFVAAELARQLSDSSATYLFTNEDLIDVSTDAAKRCGHIKEVIVIGSHHGCTSFSELMNDDGTAFRDVDINVTEDVAILPYSSGTTGLPKGVMITHYNIMSVLTQLSSPRTRGWLMAAEQNVILCVQPCYHIAGLFIGIFMGIAGGMKIVYLPKFKPEAFFEAIEKYKVTVLPLVPTLVNFMIKSPDATKYDLSSILRVSSGAGPLSQNQEDEFRQKYKVDRFTQGYGMTESTVAWLVPSDEGPYKPGCVGEPVSLTEIKVVDIETLEELGPNQRGEIWGRGPQIMKGYHGNPEATAKVIDVNGWFHTGDIGYYDEDGLFYIVDRMKELIKCKGLQVAPAELEAILLSHPAVQDCAVVGVPDERAGELPKAFIVKKIGNHITADTVHNFMKDQVASYKYLRGGVEFVAEIPRNETGKILRRVIRDRVQSNLRISKL